MKNPFGTLISQTVNISEITYKPKHQTTASAIVVDTILKLKVLKQPELKTDTEDDDLFKENFSNRTVR